VIIKYFWILVAVFYWPVMQGTFPAFFALTEIWNLYFDNMDLVIFIMIKNSLTIKHHVFARKSFLITFVPFIVKIKGML